MDIKGKAAIVTGGGTGIGAAIAERLCSAGVRVMIAGRREHRLESTTESIRKKNLEISYRPTDLRDAKACIALVQSTIDVYGSVDILVNNAGVLCLGRTIEDYSADDWDQTFAVNLRAAFLLCTAVLPVMKSKKNGFILMISSDSGIHYFPDEVIYGLTKHGMNDLVQYILAEYKQYNIHSVALCPGLTATEMGLSLNPAHRENVLEAETIADWAVWVITQPDKINVAKPILISPMYDPGIN